MPDLIDKRHGDFDDDGKKNRVDSDDDNDGITDDVDTDDDNDGVNDDKDKSFGDDDDFDDDGQLDDSDLDDDNDGMNDNDDPDSDDDGDFDSCGVTLPALALTYITTNYPTYTILGTEKSTRRGEVSYKTYIRNGLSSTKLRLIFDANGNFQRIQ